MGMDAYVSCACHQLGLTAPSPFPEHTRFVDGSWQLDLPWERRVEHTAFRLWKERSCPHPDMKHAGEHIANWTAYRLFQQALVRSAAEDFGVLLAQLPSNEGGITPSDAAALCLDELDEFRRRGFLFVNACLVDAESGEELCQAGPGLAGTLVIDGAAGQAICFDEAGLFIVEEHGQYRREVFRARRLQQELRGTDFNSSGGPMVRLTDLDTGVNYDCSLPVALRTCATDDPCRREYPRLLHLSERSIMSSEFEDILTPLERVFRAAVETGNPVYWY